MYTYMFKQKKIFYKAYLWVRSYLSSHFNSVKHISLGNASYYGNIIIVI